MRIESDYRRYLRDTGARTSCPILFWERGQGRKVKVPRALEDVFWTSLQRII